MKTKTFLKWLVVALLSLASLAILGNAIIRLVALLIYETTPGSSAYLLGTVFGYLLIFITLAAYPFIIIRKKLKA